MKQAALVMTLGVVGFAVALAMFIASRLSPEQVALIVGASCGLGVAVPLSVAIGVAINARRRHERETPPPPAVIYMAAPTAQPNLPAARWTPAIEPPTEVPRRSFSIIGNSGVEDEK